MLEKRKLKPAAKQKGNLSPRESFHGLTADHRTLRERLEPVNSGHRRAGHTLTSMAKLGRVLFL